MNSVIVHSDSMVELNYVVFERNATTLIFVDVACQSVT